MDHRLDPTPNSVHGRFSSTLEPAVTIGSGDRIIASTVDVTWGIEQHGAPGTVRRRFEPRDPERDAGGPAMVGPVAVRGARPGMTLEVIMEEIVPTTWGWTCAGPGPFNGELNREIGVEDEHWTLIRWTIDVAAGIATNEQGDRVALAPFLGTIGLCPRGVADDGTPWHCGWTPRNTGGNMDCSLLRAGASLFLPIEVDGGLLSFGDGHAVQADGESSGTAIECPMDRVALRCVLHEDQRVATPRVQVDGVRATLGFAETLDRAAYRALGAMLDWREELSGRPRAELLALSSLDVDLRVTQWVNPLRGVHAVWTEG
ncbi:MAG: acetamidase/formamidase family protein, partial [Planctomycetes bacterium]|nr:acetamidase/formamidase family protein [Planctomycetota bacterium]